MASGTFARKEVFVFDSAVPELQKLIDALGKVRKVIILDSTSEALQS